MKKTLRMFLTPESVLWRMSEFEQDNEKKYIFSWENELIGQKETEIFSTEDRDLAENFWWGVVNPR